MISGVWRRIFQLFKKGRRTPETTIYAAGGRRLGDFKFEGEADGGGKRRKTKNEVTLDGETEVGG